MSEQQQVGDRVELESDTGRASEERAHSLAICHPPHQDLLNPLMLHLKHSFAHFLLQTDVMFNLAIYLEKMGFSSALVCGSKPKIMQFHFIYLNNKYPNINLH